ncbi:hypothetical protein [Streptomyces sp. DZ1-3]
MPTAVSGWLTRLISLAVYTWKETNQRPRSYRTVADRMRTLPV